ncbi:MAG: MBL fold metallo-hydrolase, partial [Pseudomonadota bacterium]
MKLRVIGCGDAFGAGGRLQTAFHVTGSDHNMLLDCGATTMIGLARDDIDPNDITTIVISHLHGDHFSGLVWFLLHAKFRGRRSAPLTIVGPDGIEDRLAQTSELLFPGMTSQPCAFEVTFKTFDVGRDVEVDGLAVEAFAGKHPSGALFAMLRLSFANKVLAFSGDTEWVDDLVACADGADLFITECYGLKPGIPYHLDWQTLSDRL